ncbi:hypothetical protein OSCT_0654 [Oscillochloris trichoides DG-6]|uniref:DUF4097 domain-containing protein n=1 Tax=Oscillochloris trichoides DG-6 TaxID=765420 RepID=E1IBF3_9CHLR|nr:DUF4097 family beta strand repeat-containing protein [Oscillochloris trichoides]EFO81510.1 hypothetical protein OSCT_0654 [Oscillochloris trichoides DG-6]
MSTDAPSRTPMPDEPFYHRAQSRRWGGLLLLLGLVWLVFELTSRSAIFAFALVEEQVTTPPQSFSVTRVVVRGLDDHVTLSHADGDQVTLTALRHGFGWNSNAARSALQRIDLQVEQQGTTLHVDVQHLGGIPILFGRTPYADVQLAIPTGTSLDVETVSGEVRGEGLRATGSLGTVSGPLVLVDTAGDLGINTTSGDVQIRDAGAGLRIKTVSGDVRITGASGALWVESISGNLDLDAEQAAVLVLDTTSGDIRASGVLSGEINSISGDVTLTLPAASDLNLYVTTTSGEIEYDLPLRDVQQDRRSLRGVLGNGQAQLKVTTTSGDVELGADS